MVETLSPFWVKSERRLENLVSSISEAKLHGLPLSRYPLEELRQAIFENDLSQKAKLELMATETFLLFAQDISGGILNPNKIDNNINVIPERKDAKVLLASLTDSVNINLFFQSLFPSSNEYKSLLNELKKLRETSLNGSLGRPSAYRCCISSRNDT